MKFWITVAAIGAAVCALVLTRLLNPSVEHHADAVPTPEMIARGEYLVRAADCVGCHTREGGEAFAGGRLFDLGRMGRLYSPNITPDSLSGIGGWSDDDFRSAMQLGVAPGHKYLYPVFPYASFTALSDEDVVAIKAYLFSLKPVRYSPPANEMRFPFNQRFLMAFWAMLFNPNERFAPDPARSTQWNRGRYLTEALGHCGECHTPRNFLQARRESAAYSGAVTNGWRAYNITSDVASGIGGWTDDALISYLTTGRAEGHGSASGPMAEVVENSLAWLSRDDIVAMVTFLRSIEPIRSSVRASAGVRSAVAADRDSFGRALFAGICGNCHKEDGSGAQTSYEAIEGASSLRDPQATNLIQVILHGSRLKVPGRDLRMPGFGGGYSNAEIAAVANYVATRMGGVDPEIGPQDIEAKR